MMKMDTVNLEKRNRIVRRRWLGFRSERGATLVEFAFAAWLWSMVLFGLIETTIAVYCYTFVCEAARDTVRYTIVRGKSCAYMPDCNAKLSDIQTHIEGLRYYPAVNTYTLASNTTVTYYSPVGGTPNPTWTTCTLSSGCNAIGNAVKVSVNYPYTLSVPFLRPITFTMHNSSMMVISQ